MALNTKAKAHAVRLLKVAILKELDDEVHGLSMEAIENAEIDPPKPEQLAQFNFSVAIKCDNIIKAMSEGKKYAKLRAR